MSDLIGTVQQIYACFGAGDVPGILERLSPDVEWEHDMEPVDVPWLIPGRGHEHVGRFLQTVATELEFHRFEPAAMLTNDTQVAALINLDAAVRRNGRRVRELEQHLWTFDAQGRVARFRHYVDTHAHWRAWHDK